MPTLTTSSLLYLVAAITLLPHAVLGGVLYLHNGDRVSGELVSIDGGKLRFAAELLGEIVVEQDAVRAIDSDEPLNVTVAGRAEPLTGCVFRPRPAQRAQRLICAGDEGLALAMGAIVSALPPPVTAPDMLQTSGQLTLSLEDQSGNNDDTQYAVDLRTELRLPTTRHSFRAEFDFEEQGDVKTRDERKYSYQYDVFVNEKWFYSATLSREDDRFRELRSKTGGGVGLGHQFYESAPVSLSMNTGPVYVLEEFADGGEREVWNWRWNVDYRWRITARGLEFFYWHDYLRSLEESHDWEIDTEAGLRAPIIGRLRGVLKLEYDYDEKPADTDKATDKIWSLGVSYDW